MISEFFVTLFGSVVGWIADLLGPWNPPPELLDASKSVNGLIHSFAGMGAWVNWTVLGACVAAAVGTWLVVVGIKLVRAVLAHIPAFGGAGD